MSAIGVQCTTLVGLFNAWVWSMSVLNLGSSWSSYKVDGPLKPPAPHQGSRFSDLSMLLVRIYIYIILYIYIIYYIYIYIIYIYYIYIL